MPADHGPIAVYWTPRHAMAARSASVSNNSATKSATAIGRTRVIARPSSRPRPRNVRPSRSPASASPRPGNSMSGGVCPATSARKPDSARTSRSKPENASASCPDRARKPSAVRPTSPHRVTAEPSAAGANARTSGPTRDRPWRLSSRSRTTEGRSRPTVCARVGTRTPGAPGSSAVDRSSADGPGPLDDEGPLTRPAKIGGRDQPVVSSADDDRVVAVGAAGLRHVRPPSCRWRGGPRAPRSVRSRP